VQAKPTRVLLVDDDQGDFEMIRVMLSQAEDADFRVDWVATFEEALDAFEKEEHDVYFIDYFLEDRTGLDLLREARRRGISAPLIMLTGRGSRDVDMKALEAGAADYLVKGLIDPAALERSIRHAMERTRGSRSRRESGSATDPAGATEHEVGGEARFRAVFHASRSGIALVGLDGLLLDVNPAFVELFPSVAPWREGLTLVELLDPSDQAPFRRELADLSTGERTRLEAERRFTGKDGSLIWARTTAILIRDRDGNPDHLVVVLEARP